MIPLSECVSDLPQSIYISFSHLTLEVGVVPQPHVSPQPHFDTVGWIQRFGSALHIIGFGYLDTTGWMPDPIHRTGHLARNPSPPRVIGLEHVTENLHSNFSYNWPDVAELIGK